MIRLSQLRVQIACCIMLLALLSQTPGTVAIKCQKTETGYQPHSRDCGPMAKGCRIIVKPYKVQNDSGVAACRVDERPGDYIYDCAVECRPGKNDYWNEVACCTENDCNSNLDDINKKNFCYTSKHNSNQYDRLEICSDQQRCALNSQTQDTQCVEESLCKGGEWICCASKENCGNMWGVYKPDSVPQEQEALQSHRIKASWVMTLLTPLIVSMISGRFRW